MPTPKSVISELRRRGREDNGVIRLPNGQFLRLCGWSEYCIKFNMRFGRSIHYEVGWGQSDSRLQDENCLVVRLDVEDKKLGLLKSKLKEQQRNDDQILISKNTPKVLWFQISSPISCDNQSYEEIKQQVVDGLQHLYDVFEPTLIQFENQRNNNFTNAEPPNRSDSTKADMNTEIQTLLKSNLNVILTGAPGTGKTYTAKQVACAMTGDDPKAEVQPHIESVQFHPSYDYSDFVIGMKPEIVDGVNGSKAVSFDWHDGIFKTFADKALEEYDKAEDKAKAPKFVFLIDEINRADLSRVFGELFSLLEEEYRYPNNKKGVMLPNGKAFVIPRNLFIIGTMNDIDRSVESMDFALRRRFAWKEVRAKDTQKDIFDAKKPDGSAKIDPVVAEKLKKAMDALNFEIAGEEVDGKKPTLDLRLGPEYELGGAIFAKFEKCGDFNDLWKNHIEIILNEYLRGRKEKNALLTSLNGLFFESVGMAATQTAEGTDEP